MFSRHCVGQSDPETHCVLSELKLNQDHKTRDCEPRGRVLLGSLTLLLSTQVPFPNKISCFVSKKKKNKLNQASYIFTVWTPIWGWKLGCFKVIR